MCITPLNAQSRHREGRGREEGGSGEGRGWQHWSSPAAWAEWGKAPRAPREGWDGDVGSRGCSIGRAPATETSLRLQGSLTPRSCFQKWACCCDASQMKQTHHYTTLLQVHCGLCLGETKHSSHEDSALSRGRRQHTAGHWVHYILHKTRGITEYLGWGYPLTPSESYASINLEWLAARKQIARPPAEISTHFEPLIILEQLLKTQKSVSDCIAKQGMGKTNIVVTFISNLIVIVETVLCPFSSLGKSVLIMKTYLIKRSSRKWQFFFYF